MKRLGVGFHQPRIHGLRGKFAACQLLTGVADAFGSTGLAERRDRLTKVLGTAHDKGVDAAVQVLGVAATARFINLGEIVRTSARPII